MSDTPSKDHNLKPRADTINEVIREIATLEAERKDLTDRIRDVKAKKIKGDLGMKIADFNAAYRLYKLEGEDRDQFFDTLRETFTALGVGEQLDFIPAMSSSEASPQAAE